MILFNTKTHELSKERNEKGTGFAITLYQKKYSVMNWSVAKQRVKSFDLEDSILANKGYAAIMDDKIKKINHDARSILVDYIEKRLAPSGMVRYLDFRYKKLELAYNILAELTTLTDDNYENHKISMNSFFNEAYDLLNQRAIGSGPGELCQHIQHYCREIDPDFRARDDERIRINMQAEADGLSMAMVF